MAIQTKYGKAFEYATLSSIAKFLAVHQEVCVYDTAALRVAKNFFDNVEETLRNDMIAAADASLRVLLALEPQLQNPCGNEPLYLMIQEDSAGISGDVRDILTIRQQNEWEIGISCKHNHSAVKHSRLSASIDFGLSWFGVPCSRDYFTEINPLFEKLVTMKGNGVLWRDVPNKEAEFYVPLLEAFMREVRRLDEEHPTVIPNSLLRYLLGRHDFYKVITNDRRKFTQIQAYNLYGTLNRNSGTVQPQVRIPRLTLPTRFFDVAFKQGSNNTVQIVCNEGWTVNMRIHNASTIVEPSLKFDVTLGGVPSNLHTRIEPWG